MLRKQPLESAVSEQGLACVDYRVQRPPSIYKKKTFCLYFARIHEYKNNANKCHKIGLIKYSIQTCIILTLQLS